MGDESRWLQILPSDSLRISYTLDNRHPAIGLQVASLEVTETSFVEEIAAARTYGFLKDVPMMRQNGLASWPDPNADGSFSLPPEYQQKTPRLVDAWRNHCARYNPSGHIEVHG